MKPRILIAFVAGVLLCDSAQAQHVLSYFSPSSYGYGKKSSLPRGDGGNKPDHNTGATASNSSPWWLGRDSVSAEVDDNHGGHSYDREDGLKLYILSVGHLTEYSKSGKFGDFEDEGRGNHGPTTSVPNQSGLPADCSPIPEPPTDATLLAMVALGLVVWHRRFGVGLKG